jgi:hypothetical protein
MINNLVDMIYERTVDRHPTVEFELIEIKFEIKMLKIGHYEMYAITSESSLIVACSSPLRSCSHQQSTFELSDVNFDLSKVDDLIDDWVAASVKYYEDLP